MLRGNGPLLSVCMPTPPTQSLVLPATLLCRLTKVVAEGKAKKGVDSALRAAAVGMADKAVGVRVGCLIACSCCLGEACL